MIGIYGFHNLITNKWYIGQSIHIEERKKQHIYEANSKRSKNNKFYNALNKYGISNFEFIILEECLPEQLNEKEVFWIDKYNSYKNGYNSTPGGQEKYFNPQEIFDAWDEGLSIQEISKKLNIGTSCIYYNLNEYKNYTKHEAKVRGGNLLKLKFKNKNKIYQYDFDGNFIQSWSSCKEIQRTLGYDAAVIGKCLQGHRLSAYKFQWKNYYKQKIDPYKK